MDNEDVVHIYNGILLGYKKKILPFATYDATDGPRGCYAKGNKLEKNKYRMILLVYGI